MPPQISSNRAKHQEIIDVDKPTDNNEERKSSQQRESNNSNSNQIQKQKLLPNKPKFKFQKVEVQEFKFNQSFSIDIMNALCDVTQVFSKQQMNQKDDDILSPSFNFFSNIEIRKNFQKTLQMINSLDKNEIKERVQQAHQYQLIYKDQQIFRHKSSLKFAQLHSQLPFIAKSQVTTDNYFALLIDDAESIHHVAEYVVYNLLYKQECDAEYPFLFTLTLDQNKVKEEFGEELKKFEGFDPSIIFQDLRSKSDDINVRKDKILTIQDINEIDQIIQDETDFGLMLYYGGNKIEVAGDYDEAKYAKYLLQHVIIGLKTLQHKGSMILKVLNTFTNFSNSIIFILSRLFEGMIVTKPYASSPLSQTLKEAKPKRILQYLTSLYQKILENDKFSIACLELIELKVFDQEERLRTYIQQVNDNLIIYRESEIYPHENQLKEALIKCLSEWGLNNPTQSQPKKLEDLTMQDVYQANLSAKSNQRLKTSAYQQQPEEPQIKPPSEEEQVRYQRIKDQIAGDFIDSISAQKEALLQKQKEKEKKLALLKIKKQKEQEQKKFEEQKEQLRQKLQMNNQKKKGGQSNAAKKSKNQGDDANGDKAIIAGDKISIPIARSSQSQGVHESSNNSDQQKDKNRKRDQKAEDKAQDRTQNKITIKQEERKQDSPIKSEITQNKRKHPHDHENDNEIVKQKIKRPKLNDANNSPDHNGVSKPATINDQIDEEQKKKEILEKIERNKRQHEEEQRQRLANLQNLSKYIAK